MNDNSAAYTNWPFVPLGECCTVHPGQHILENAYNRRREGIPYLTGPADFGEISPIICRWSDSPKAWALPGDVLVTVKGAGVGKTNLAPESKVAIGRQLMAVRPGRGLNQRYLFYLFRHAFERFQQAALGATVPGLGRNDIESLEIPLPPLAEQERIAAQLTEQLAAVASARAAALARRAAAAALPAAYLHEVFEGPDASEWPEKELGKGLVNIQAGTSVVAMERPALGPEWGVLKVSALSWGRFLAEENKAVPPGYVPAAHEQVQAGDLLISRANTAELAGAIVLVRETPPRLMLSDKTLRLVVNRDVFLPEFLEFAIRTSSVRRFIEANATGTSYSMRNISQDTIRYIPVRTPPLESQRRIAAGLAHRVAETKRLTAHLCDELAAIDALPAALLREAFGASA